MTVRDQLIADMDSFLCRHGMSPTKLGLLALNDRAFVSRLRNGEHQPNAKTVDRIRDFMAAYKPPKINAA